MSVREERVIPLKRASSLFPSRPKIGTLRRWCLAGVLNVYTGQHVSLEYFRIASRYFTSEEAVRRYIDAMNHEKRG